MARTQAQLNAAILANRQRNAPIFAERAARAKETGQDLDTTGRQMRDEAHQASLKRLYGNDLDTTNPAAVNAARAAKQAAAAQTRMDARQVRDNALNARVAAGEQDMPQRPMSTSQVSPLPPTVSPPPPPPTPQVSPPPPTPPMPQPQVGAPAPQPQVLPQQNNPTGPGMKRGGSVNYTDKNGRINLGHGRISTTAKGKKNSAW